MLRLLNETSHIILIFCFQSNRRNKIIIQLFWIYLISDTYLGANFLYKMFMFIARFLYIRILYVCKIRYVSYTIRYVFRMIRWVSYTKRYVSCTIWYASYTLRKLHAFNTLTGCISAFYGTGIKRLKNLKTHNYPTYIHPNIYFAYIFKEFVFTQFSPMAKRWQVACIKIHFV